MTRSFRLSLYLALLLPALASAQSKKPLDHSVYDGWQSIGVKTVSNNGQWAAYTVTPQEGDATLVIRDLRNGRQVSVPRGSAPVITEDSRYVIFYIKPLFQETRQARIKKKLPSDMPKDSLGILELGQTAVTKIPNVKSFKTPEKGSGLLAYLKEKPKDTTARATLVKPAPLKDIDADDDTPGKSPASDAGDLVIMHLGKQKADTVKNVTSYTISKPGNRLVLVTNPGKKDSLGKPAVILRDAASGKSTILSNGHGTFAQFSFDEKGEQLAYLCSRDSAKALQKFYSLHYFKPGQDSAHIAVTRSTQGIPKQWSVSENGVLTFSRNGERIFFGTAPIPKPKDTTIVDFEVAKVDIWHYQDDYLQTMQLKNLDRDLKKNYAAVYFPAQQRMIQLADESMENFIPGDEGNANYGLGYTDANNRVALQWTGSTLKSGYVVNIATGERKPIKTNIDGNFSLSPGGRFVLWFDFPEGQWHTFETATGISRVISANIPARITDEEMDMPDYPRPYGMNGWQEHDRYVYINDRYDIWQVDPLGKVAPLNLTRGEGRRMRTSFRILRLDKDERFMRPKQQLLLAGQNDSSKYGGLWSLKLQDKKGLQLLVTGPYAYSAVDKAKNADMYLFQRSSFVESPDVFAGADFAKAERISALNPQQKSYNWGTAELFSWQTYNGKTTEGILYKPEDFDPNKKYPVLIYFYEKLTDGLYSYQAPAPTPSRLNITFFVSRGYVVLAPDIRYETGHPGKSAYDYIVSGAEALAKNPWIDKANMGIQGQSWGGYQVCYLITATPLFKAAWAGAPVANMTSAYGGIRWESGMNRQFQYEHSQSRIGATLWDKPELYIENSPLFHVPKVTTPLAIMHNDADGAVPWYQGIEMFTAMRRLGKPVWMLNYNGEAHNLVHRQNRKDIQMREQQFFDHFLKGAPAPKWLSKGVPAVDKGKDWGFDY